ncbi:uncharacterized protein LOC144603812 [Rhinoraja longicauda]
MRRWRNKVDPAEEPSDIEAGRHVASKDPGIPVCGHWAELDLGRHVASKDPGIPVCGHWAELDLGRHIASMDPGLPICGRWAELDIDEIYIDQWLPYSSFYLGPRPAPDIWYR